MGGPGAFPGGQVYGLGSRARAAAVSQAAAIEREHARPPARPARWPRAAPRRSPRPATGPRRRTERERCRGRRASTRLGDQGRVGGELAESAVRDGGSGGSSRRCRGRAAACEPSNGRRSVPQARDDGGEQHRCARLERARRALPRANWAASGMQAERGDRREQRPDGEQQAGASVAPGESEPAGGERPRRRVASPSEMFASGKNSDGERVTQPERGAPTNAARGGERAEPERPAGRVERQRGGDPAGGDAGERVAGQHALGRTSPAVDRPGAAGPRRPSAWRAAPASAASAAPAPGGRPTGRRCGFVTSALATVSSTCRGRSGRSDSSGGAPCWIRRDVSPGRRPRTDARRRAPPRAARRRPRRRRPASRSAPLQPLGRDVGERPGNVAERGQRVELRHLCEAEVEQPHVDARRTRRAARSTASRRGGRCRGRARARAPRQIWAATSIAARSSSSPARIASRSVRPGMYS